jgi:hypothetical protein
MFEVANEYEIPTLLMENVAQVIEMDQPNPHSGKPGHGVHTLMLQKASALDYWLVRTKMVKHGEVGGCTTRRRVFWVFAKLVMWKWWPSSMCNTQLQFAKEASHVRDLLTKADEVPPDHWLIPLEMRESNKCADDSNTNKPQVKGTITWQGQEEKVSTGSLVLMKAKHQLPRPKNKQYCKQVWRVLEQDGSWILLMNAIKSKSRGSQHWRHTSKVNKLLVQMIKVYLPNIIPSLTAFGEPPERPGCLVWQGGRVRKLNHREMWMGNGCSIAKLDFLERNGCDLKDITRCSGNSIPISMGCEGAAGLVNALARSVHAMQLEDALGGVPITCLDGAPTPDWLPSHGRHTQVVLLLLSKEGEVCWAARGGELVIGAYQTLPAKQSGKQLVETWLSKLNQGELKLSQLGGRCEFEWGARVVYYSLLTASPMEHLPIDVGEWKCINDWGNEELEAAATSCKRLVNRLQHPTSSTTRANHKYSTSTVRGGVRANQQALKQAEIRSEIEVHQVIADCKEAEGQLRQMLMDAVEEDPKLQAWMRSGADEISDLDLADVPMELLRQHVWVDWEEACCTPFSQPRDCEGNPLPAHTKRRQPPSPNEMPTGFNPRSVEEHLNSTGRNKLREYLPKLLEALQQGKSNLPPLMIGRDCYLKESLQAGPCIHEEGKAARPIDATITPPTHLDVNFIQEQLKYNADQE